MIPTAPAILDALLATTIPTVGGWSTVEKCQYLGRRILETTATLPISVDLGVFAGRSLYAMASAHRLLGRGLAIGIDPYTPAAALEGHNAPENDAWWQQIDYERIYQEMLTLLRTVDPDVWQVHRLRSLDAVGLLPPGSVTLLHQDSNHSTEVALSEIHAWQSRMAPDAWWVIDDTDWPTVNAVLPALTQAGYVLRYDAVTWQAWHREPQ